MPDEDASALISDAIPGMKSLEVEEQVDRLSTKYDYYHAIGFKWYFVLIAYGVGVIGWFSPEISLIFRKRLVKFETTEDVMQLQTMMITLSNTKMDVYKALKWLMTESTIHKAILRQAWINYPSDPEKAISQLKSSCENRDMKRLVSKLGKAIYSLSLHDAFNDMILDKEQSLIINEMYQDEQIKSKVQYAKLLVAMSAGFSLFANFLGPIGLLGVKQLLSTFALLQNG
jgi:Fe-S cluster biosynthesis and repair protein YggX